MQQPRNWRVRPSAAPAWVVCPGMLRLSAGQVCADQDTTVREEGTACHWGAYMAFTGHAVHAGIEAPNGVALTDEMLDAIEIYRAAMAAWPTTATRHFELPVHCADIHEECGGTLDAGAWCPDTRTLFVGDLKYGFRHVSAWQNWQLLCYVSGLMRHFYLTPDDVQRVVLTIVQPRGYGQLPVRQAVYTMAEVLPLWETLRISAAAAMALDSVCVTNPGCGDCDGRHQCTAIQSAALSVLDACHAATPDNLPFAAAENELRMLKWARDIVDARISGLEQQVTHGIKRGALSRHWEMRESMTALKWNMGAADKVKTIANLLGVEVTKPAQVITPTQAIPKLGKELVALHAQRIPSGPKLVPVDPDKWRRILESK